jgi:ubiquitin-conjugating enzyme E2 O
MKFFSQVTADPQYQIVKSAELHSSAEDFPEEKHIIELVTQLEKPQLPSEMDTKRFDVVVDCSDHHFVKESGHENVILCLMQIYFFILKL